MPRSGFGLNELLDRCCTVDEVTTSADSDPEKYANDGTSSVTRIISRSEKPNQGIASATKNKFKEDFKKNPTDNAENSTKSLASNFSDWHE